MDGDAISDFLAVQRDTAPVHLQPAIMEFETLWERKLWHELTNALVRFFNDPRSAPLRLGFWNVFITKFADKINQLKLVELALKAATQCKDYRECLVFTEAVAKKVDHEDSQDAFVFATVAVSHVRLDLRDYVGCRQELDKAERVLDKLDSVETVVHAAFYSANANYYQAKREFASYYRNTLLYLACVDLESLNLYERREKAYDLGVAALCSSSIYNFGELLLHPIINDMAPGHKWMRDLLFAFNRGDLAAYDQLSFNIEETAVLQQHSQHLRQKMYLAALTEAVFRRPPHERAMTFDMIAAETKVRPEEIEHLIMKALSLGLLRGSIDQVDKVAYIHWVQPKVLDMKQIDNMRLRLKDWDSNVNQLGNWIESVGQDVWAA